MCHVGRKYSKEITYMCSGVSACVYAGVCVGGEGRGVDFATTWAVWWERGLRRIRRMVKFS